MATLIMSKSTSEQIINSISKIHLPRLDNKLTVIFFLGYNGTLY